MAAIQAKKFRIVVKKLLLLAVISASTLVGYAQEKTAVVKDTKTVKKTSSLPQKVHNTFSKDKEYNGKKTKHVKTVQKSVPVKQ